MPSSKDPLDSLTDIVDQAARIQRYVLGLDRDRFEADGLVRDAVERCIERVCEAAAHFGEAGPALMPSQPWADIRGMGNWLRHACHRIDADVVWAAAAVRVPSLAVEAQAASDRLISERADS